MILVLYFKGWAYYCLYCLFLELFGKYMVPVCKNQCNNAKYVADLLFLDCLENNGRILITRFFNSGPLFSK